MKYGIALLGLLALGCGRSDDLMPMKVGDRWSYSVSGRMSQSIGHIEVAKEAAVAGTSGLILSGPMGESRLAWVDDRLLMERAPNCVFEPAIPLVYRTDNDIRRHWSGKLRGIWGEETAEAVLDQSKVEEQIGGRKMRVTKSFLLITGKAHRIRLQTYFQDGVGIAAQKQWVDGEQILNLERLSSG